jgi:hypothetical protein
MILRSLLPAALGGLAACAPADVPDRAAVAEEEVFAPEYLGIQTILLDNDLVSFRVSMKGARGNDDVAAYARCAAAQYSLIRGYGFARHVRTNVAKTGGVWRGDAVYTISATLPRGLAPIDAEVTVRDCGEQGIPTV